MSDTIEETKMFWVVKFKIKQKFKVRRLLDEDFAKSINWNAKNDNAAVIFNQNGEVYFCFGAKEDQKKFAEDLQKLCMLRSIPLRFFGTNNAVPVTLTKTLQSAGEIIKKENGK